MSRIYAVAALLTAGLLAASPLYSQPPPNLERATYETDQIGRQEAERARARPPIKPAKVTEAELPVVEDAEVFPIKTITLDGCETFPAESFSGIVSQYEGKEIGINAIQRLSKQIERDYLKRGVIAAVFAPPQDVKEGVLTLKVIEAKMGEVHVKEAMWFDSEHLRYYWPIRAGEVLRYDKISKSIQLMNKNPDREVKAALHAGKTPGTTDITLTPETQVPVHGSFTYDNDGSPSTGNLRTGFGGRHNNFLGYDDMLMGGYTFGKDFSSTYAYHNLPISPGGASLLYGFSKSVSTPKKDFLPYDMRTWADKLDLSVHQDIYKKDEYIGEVYAAFAAQDKKTFANSGGPPSSPAGTINRDRLRTLNFGGTYVKRALGATATVSPQFTQGLGILGASPEGDPYLTRGAQPVFSKFSLAMMSRTALPFDVQQSLKLNSQFASAKLNPSEGLSFGGIDSVRGYPAGDVIVDNGLLVNYELTRPLFFFPKDYRLPYASTALRDDVRPVAFLDYGYGQRRGELKKYHEVGIGMGMRISFYNQATMRLDWGYPIGDHPQTNGRAWFLHFALNFNDTMPEEMARISKAMDEERIRQAAWRLLEEEMKRTDGPVRPAFYGYFAEAREAEKEGRLEDAAAWYGKIQALSGQLYGQAETYVRSCKEQEYELKCDSKRAELLQREGKTQEAMEIWQRITEDAKPKPFALESDQLRSFSMKK